MIRSALLLSITLLACLSGCSSAPERNYQVNTYQLLSHSWMAQADRKRQLEAYDEALELYQKAFKYAQQRNDRYNMGIARLKSAAIYITQNKLDKAQLIINQVSQMVEYEDVLELKNPLKFISAKLLQGQNQTEQALESLKQLEQTYIEQPERNIYYRLVRWSYRYDSVASDQVTNDLLALDKLVAQRALSNIEIYSFALYTYAKWLTEQNRGEAEAAINKAITHFSSLELGAKIRDCYKLAVKFYRAQGLTDKARYFESRVKGYQKRQSNQT